MEATARREQENVPYMFVSSTRLKSSSFMRISSESEMIPALLMRISTGPNLSVVFSNIASTAARSETSAPTAIASPPALRISSATASASSGWVL